MPKKQTTWIGFLVILIAGAFSSISLFQAKDKFIPGSTRFQIASIGGFASIVIAVLAIALWFYFNEKDGGKVKDINAAIMVVDDDDGVRTLLKRVLEDAGYTVVAAANGQEAIKIFPSVSVNMVLLDITMPGLNGYQTLEIIRRQSNIPVLMITGGAGDAGSVRNALELGADDYIKKPIRPRELLARVSAKLRRA